MDLLALLSIIASSTLPIAATPTPNTTNPCTNSTWTSSKLPITQVMTNWGQLWKGNFTLLNQTVTPDVAIWQDLIPSPSRVILDGSATNPHVAKRVEVTNQAQLVEFMQESQKGFAEYGFVNQFYFVNDEGNKLVTRWTLNAIVGEDTTSTIRKPGDKVTMNGTDIIMFDDCSGRIAQVLTAQDILGFTYDMGIDVDLPWSERL